MSLTLTSSSSFLPSSSFAFFHIHIPFIRPSIPNPPPFFLHTYICSDPSLNFFFSVIIVLRIVSIYLSIVHTVLCVFFWSAICEAWGVFLACLLVLFFGLTSGFDDFSLQLRNNILTFWLWFPNTSPTMRIKGGAGLYRVNLGE